MGRSSIIVNIPSKPESESYKIWVLANGDYVLDWLYHAKGDEGSVDLNTVYTKEWGYSKTQAVVFDLLQQEGIPDDFSCVVWIDNLFTSADVIVTCKHIGFGAAGTVRTTKTKREELEEKQDTKAQKQRKEFNRGLDTCLADLKLKHGAQIE